MTETKTKTFVEFVFPGLLFSETSVREVECRDRQMKMPKGAYGFRFFDVTDTVVDGETLTGNRKNFSPMHYPGAETIPADKVPERFPDDRHKILRSNVRINEMRGIILTRTGNAVEWREDDVVMP